MASRNSKALEALNARLRASFGLCLQPREYGRLGRYDWTAATGHPDEIVLTGGLEALWHSYVTGSANDSWPKWAALAARQRQQALFMVERGITRDSAYDRRCEVIAEARALPKPGVPVRPLSMTPDAVRQRAERAATLAAQAASDALLGIPEPVKLQLRIQCKRCGSNPARPKSAFCSTRCAQREAEEQARYSGTHWCPRCKSWQTPTNYGTDPTTGESVLQGDGRCGCTTELKVPKGW